MNKQTGKNSKVSASFKKITIIFSVLSCFVLALGLFTLCTGCGNSQVADTVVYGTIYTAEADNNGTAEAFAVKDGKYIYVGDKEGAKQYIKEGTTQIINQTDKGMIIPGCTEAHGHYIGMSGLFEQFPGYGKKYEELLPLLEEKFNSNPKPEYWVSYGFDIEDFILSMDESKSYAEEIEERAPGIPVIFIDNNAHEALANVTALKAAGIYENCDVRGGEVKKTTSGAPSGLILDELLMYVVEKVIPLDKADDKIFESAVKNGVNDLHSRGYTNYLDAGLNFFVEDKLYESTKKVDEAKELTINMDSCFVVRSYNSGEIKEKITYAKELADKNKSTHFNPSYIKLFADGVVEAGTGWLMQEYPFAEKGQEHGNIVWKQEELNALVKESNSQGLTVHTHAYGDAACQAIINSYINASKELGKENINTIGHVRNITKEDIQRCADNKIGIAENLIWHSTTLQEGEYVELLHMALSSTLPDGIYESGYPMKSLLDAGVNVASSTDSPCGESLEGNIFNVIETATTGMDVGKDSIAFAPSELLTVREVLNALTIEGAKQLGFGDTTGSIKVGKNADFIIIDTNFLDYTGEKLRTIHNSKVEAVYFEGKEVYTNKK
ncbi:MAG: amidohydrolase family protein [Coriobacteriales bacterium]|nr:amidohydrolase family protein [Coriobacteriales bacterium]